MPPPPPPAPTKNELHWVACGRVGRCSESKDLAESDEVHEIRCCADEVPDPIPSGWNFVNRGGGVPFQSRRLTALLALTLRPRIFAKRQEQGSVLLPSSRATVLVALDVTFDNDLIWSSTIGVPPPPSPAPTVDDSWTLHTLPGRAWIVFKRRWRKYFVNPEND